VILGRGDFSQPGNENVIYIRLLDDETFLLAVVGSITDGEVIKNDATFQRALASVKIVTDAPFAEDPARYTGIAQSTSEEGFPQLGDPNAPVHITEIGSFDCPACRSFHDLAFPVLLERIQKGEVFFTYVPVFGTGSLPRGQRAATAALCVAQQNPTLFWVYHDGLFGWQDFGQLAFLDARLQNGVATLEIDPAAFDECLQTQATLPILEKAAAFVKALPEFSGTPTILLNGEQINWSHLPSLIDDAVAASQAPAGTAEAVSTVEAAATAEATAVVVPVEAATATATAQP
jgi:protein-disulfide isomerase